MAGVRCAKQCRFVFIEHTVAARGGFFSFTAAAPQIQ
jgi:hypothetical protein